MWVDAAVLSLSLPRPVQPLPSHVEALIVAFDPNGLKLNKNTYIYIKNKVQKKKEKKK